MPITRRLDVRGRLADDAGFVVPMALIVLLVLTALVGAAIAVATNNSKSTTHDATSKAALAAAEAGLQVASYRLSMLKPVEAQCINESAVATPTSGYCKTVTAEPLGNSASFQYTTTPALASGTKCAGETITAVSGKIQRCITSEGQLAGAEPVVRLQTRVESTAGESLFGIKGILGLEEVLVSGSVKATALVTSNKKIIGEGSAAFEQGFELCPGGTFKPEAGKERNHGGVTVHGVGGMSSAGPEWEKTRSSTECPIKATTSTGHATSTENEDVRITNKEDPKSEGYGAVPIKGEEPVFTGTPKYQLTVGNGGEGQLTLEGSKYYFCSVEVSGKLKINPVSATKKVEIFIDSHETNSNCPASGGGVFKLNGAGRVENTYGAGSLLIQVAGKGKISLEAGGSITASIYAPESEVVLSGAAALTGAIVGNKVKMTAGSFLYSEESASWKGSNGGGGGYGRQSWVQCTPSGTTPETGC
ncbi:MAG TPA: hypothetical protein VGX69_11285 [Solirubrobacteraceae bacterium]|nr:hypothetical protein [Solirubrobacteraceae bacterium]